MSLDQYRLKSQRRGDPGILLIVLGLCLFGLLMISSASVVVSYQNFGSNNVYLIRQAIYFAVGLVAMIATSLINYGFWRKYSKLFLIISLILLVLVEIPGIGRVAGGAQRWIYIGPVSIQPSEIIKLSFIIYAAAWLEKKKDNLNSLSNGVLPFAILLGIVSFLIIRQPDLGTTLVVASIAFIMLLAADAPLKYIFGSFLSGLALFFLLVRSSQYRWERFLTFLNPKVDIQGAGYQINQALIAIGSGGWFGLGFGMSKQKYLFLPEVQTDAIFAVTVEELGFLRASLIILAFVALGLKGFLIARQAPDLFARLLAVGITSWILFQAFVNMSGIMGAIPLAGIPLPFISAGGSSLVSLMAGIGILYNISKHSEAVAK
jgi:cell division protein FtsW